MLVDLRIMCLDANKEMDIFYSKNGLLSFYHKCDQEN